MMGMLLAWVGLIFLLLLPASTSQKIEEVPLVPELMGTKSPWEGTTDWFYIDRDKKVLGPVGGAILKDLWKGKNLSVDSWVWHEKTIEWKMIRDVRDLSNWLETTT